MKILNKITVEDLKLNKKRTIVTILGISLAVALMCAVTSFVSSFQSAIVERTKKVDGSYHLLINDINSEQLNYIKNNPNIYKTFVTQQIGYSVIDGTKEDDRNYYEIKAYDDEGFKDRGINLVAGRLPQNDNEILMIDSSYLGDITLADGSKVSIKDKYKLGNKIKLDIGSLDVNLLANKLNDAYLTANGMENQSNFDRNAKEFQIQEVKEYTIVGVISDIQGYGSSSLPISLLVTKLDNINTSKNMGVGVILKNPKDTYQLKDNLVKKLKIDSNNISENKELLRYLGVFPSDTTTKTVMILAIIVIGIILFTSIFVIRNSFNISLTEKTKELGMLASIGATSKQIKRSILFEGFIIGVIAIPIGIIIGLLAIYIVLAIVNHLLMDSSIVDNFDLKFVISPIVIAVSVIVSIIMIFVSSLKPAKRAAKITPIDAIRETNDVKISSKKLKVSKLTKKLFGIPGEIGAKNFKRSKKKYRTTIFSITLSIILFISMNAVIENVFKASDYMYSGNGEDNIVVNTPSSDEKSKYEYFDKILKLDNIEKYAIVKEFTVFAGEPYISKEYRELVNYEDEQDGITAKVTVNEVNISIVSVGDVQYKEYLKELGLTEEEAQGKGILYDQFWGKQEDKRIQYSVLNINSGDELEFEYLKENEENPEKVKLPIILKTDKTPMSMFQENNGEPVIIISDSLMKKYEDSLQAVNLRTTGIYIKSNDPYKLEQEIENIDSTNKNMIFNIEQSKKQNETMSLILSIFSYGFIIVISVIGITNIFNTITTNMALRSKEFAILKSVGMTNKEFKKMINYESLLYGIKSIFYGIPIGLILSYLIYNVMSESLETEYRFPLIAVIISIVVVFIIIFITMRYASKKSQKINLIETIRSENI